MGDYEILIRKRGFLPDDTIQTSVRLTEESVEYSNFDLLDLAFSKVKEDLLKQLPVKFKTIKKNGEYLCNL